jgi:murein DD-endopeptidase MepM/ murein hydrolase activator NlpD
MNYFKKLLLLIVFLSFFASITNAQTIDDLKNKISDKNDAISKLEQEIKQYQAEIDVLGKEKDSLSNTIKSLDISKKKLEANTKITESKISAKNLEIKELSLQIGDKSERINDSKGVISKSLASIYETNTFSIVESILGKRSFSDIWKSNDQLSVLQANTQNRIEELSNLKTNLESNKKLTEKKKTELVVLTNDLKNQAKIIAATTAEKNSILKETKNTEANYNKMLAARKAQKEAFEREVSALENALKIAIDPSSIPSTGSGILKFPLDKIRITQYFGNTEFATKNPRIYSAGKGHNGVDFAASIGTPVKAAMTGVVVGSGNMGQYCSYGKWIMIKHENGLSTLYAHLSLINVTQGQNVYTGQIIGYSGNTGITTGPHLHFGVYATQGVRTQVIATSCGKILYPLTDPSAYLNPLSYL